ncbi:hypothetical protein LCGC14_1521380 [marine sediment metagenome]|uniref:Uncharacterized protein n=1 Tax=marine sediment metagenome TaxID=412755 RepID=A0A0F9IYQ9_9ZZZZ
MKNVEDPFSDKQGTTLLEGIAKELSGVDTDDFTGMVRRIAEIDDELSRRGIDPLVKEKDMLRKALKDAMLSNNKDMVFDELSNHEAVLQQRSSDSWDVDKFMIMLSPSQRNRYIVTTPSLSESAIKDGIKNGDLSRAELEAKGAVVKKPGAKALYVRARKQEDDA